MREKLAVTQKVLVREVVHVLMFYVAWTSFRHLAGSTDARLAARGGPYTSLMVRGVPLAYTQDMLLEEWPIDGSYDFLYLPRSAGGRANLGYAFINFVSESHARSFRARWHGRRLRRFQGEKCLRVGLADVQGLEANVTQLRAKPAARMRSRGCQPIIVGAGRVLRLLDL